MGKKESKVLPRDWTSLNKQKAKATVQPRTMGNVFCRSMPDTPVGARSHRLGYKKLGRLSNSGHCGACESRPQRKELRTFATLFKIPIQFFGTCTIAMINSGAIENFISTTFVQKHCIQTKRKTNAYWLAMADNTTSTMQEETYSGQL